MPHAEGSTFEPLRILFFFLLKFMLFVGKIVLVCGKDNVGLWEKSHRFVGKITLVCGKNHVGLWEKFV